MTEMESDRRHVIKASLTRAELEELVRQIDELHVWFDRLGRIRAKLAARLEMIYEEEESA